MLYGQVPFPDEGTPNDGGARDRPAETAASADPDGRLAAAVYGRLLLDKRVNSTRITVRCQAGVVLLGGRTDSAEARERRA